MLAYLKLDRKSSSLAHTKQRKTHTHTHTLPGSEVDNPKHIKRQLPFSRAHLQVIAQLDLPKYNTREAEVKIQAYKGHIQQSEGLGLV